MSTCNKSGQIQRQSCRHFTCQSLTSYKICTVNWSLTIRGGFLGNFTNALSHIHKGRQFLMEMFKSIGITYLPCSVLYMVICYHVKYGYPMWISPPNSYDYPISLFSSLLLTASLVTLNSASYVHY